MNINFENLTINAETLCEILKNERPFILDVRNPSEYREANINGHLIPLNELPARLHELPEKDEIIIVHCQLGMRSQQAAQFLQQMGYTHVMSLEGGLAAYLKIAPLDTK